MRTALHRRDPRRIGRYELTARLGEGGQGVVYLGTAPSGQRVAVKLLHAQFADDPTARARFVREVKAAARVSPAFTARFIDADISGDQPWVASEYIDAPTLQQSVDDSGPLPPDELHRLAVDTATALAALHAIGIAHRDFKPGNILMAPDGPKVIDFGIARALDATATLTTSVVGSPAYMTPEQFDPPRGQPPGTPVDIFAWAGTMIFAATGQPPFGIGELGQRIHRILHTELELGGVPLPLREPIAAALVKDPDRRPTADTLVRWLRTGGIADSQATVPHGVAEAVPQAPAHAAYFAVPEPGGRRNRRAIVAVVAAAVAAGALGSALALLLPELGQKASGARGSPDPDRTGSASPSAPPSTTPPSEPGADPAAAGQTPGPLPGTDSTLMTALDGPLTLYGYSVYANGSSSPTRWIWNEASEEFVRDNRHAGLSYGGPSPDGMWLTARDPLVDPESAGRVIVYHHIEDTEIVLAPENLDADADELGLTENETPVLTGPQWSPDGSRLLLTVLGHIPEDSGTGSWRTLGYAIAEPAETESMAFVPFLEMGDMVWHPDGERLVHLTYEPLEPGQNEAQVFDVGETSGDALLTGSGSPGYSTVDAFSPDGTRIATHCRTTVHDSTDTACVFDIRTGELTAEFEIGKPDGGVYGTLGWYDDDHLLVDGLADRGEETMVVVVDLSGWTTERLIDQGDDSASFHLYRRPD